MPIDKDFLLVLKSNCLGEGEPDLGEKLMKSFLEVISNSPRLPAKIICLNSGIFLTTEGSPVREVLEKLAAAGVEINSCTTCLNYHKRMDKMFVGKSSNMQETVMAMQGYSRVLIP